MCECDQRRNYLELPLKTSLLHHLPSFYDPSLCGVERSLSPAIRGGD